MTVRVWAYTNAEQVVLTLPNGTQLAPSNVSAYSHAEWLVPYSAGNLTAQAYRSGKLVASDQVRTTGAATALRASIKDGVGVNLSASVREVALVQIEVVDSAGERVVGASDEVTLSVTGPAQLLGTANGDPASLTPDRSHQRQAYHGLMLGVVGPVAGAGGMIQVTASAPGLKPSTLEIFSSFDCNELAL